MFGLFEAIIIVVAILVLFGGAKLPGLSKGIGKMINHIKYGLRGDDGIQVRENAKQSLKKNENEHHTE